MRLLMLTGRHEGKVVDHPLHIARQLVDKGVGRRVPPNARATDVEREYGKTAETADQPAPETPESRTLDAWPLQTSPEEYLERYPDGPNADLARSLVGE